MQESKPLGSERSIGKRLMTNFVVSEFCLIAGNLAVRICNREALLPTWTIAFIGFAMALPMVFFAIGFFRMLRADLDEMLQRIVLEGLAFAMIVFVSLAESTSTLVLLGSSALDLIHLNCFFCRRSW